jgi:oligosaccharide repeat unit polymerase
MATIEVLFAVNTLLLAGVILLDFLHTENLKLNSAFALAYFFSAVLPVAVQIAGGQIYAGIDIRYIPDALFLSSLCLAGLFVAGLLTKAGTPSVASGAWEPRRPGEVSAVVAVVVFSLILLAAAYSVENIFMPKVAGSDALFGLHYKILLIGSVFCCVFLSLYWTTSGLAAYGFFAFVGYCLVFQERDFFLVGLLGALILYSKKTIGKKSVLVIAILALTAFSYLSVGRSTIFESLDILTFANQGSNLFVNTFVMRYFEHISVEDLYWGQTYCASLLDTVTFGFIPARPTLANWLAEQYAGVWATGGYGFSIEAEAYMNFGYCGAFILFLVIGVFLAKTEKRAMRGYLSGRLMLGWSVMFLMYGIRGESLNVFKSLLFVTIVATIIHLFDMQTAWWRSVARPVWPGMVNGR